MDAGFIQTTNLIAPTLTTIQFTWQFLPAGAMGDHKLMPLTSFPRQWGGACQKQLLHGFGQTPEIQGQSVSGQTRSNKTN